MTILSFQRRWLSLNASGYLVCLTLLILQGHALPAILRHAVIIPMATMVALALVLRVTLRWETVDVPADLEAPPAVWRAALGFSLLTVGTTLVAILSIDRIEEYRWLLVVLGGWIGCNLANWLHYRSQA